MTTTAPGVTMAADELMAAADALTDVHPGMTHDALRAALDRATPGRQLAVLLVGRYRREVQARGDILEALARLASEEPAALRGLATVRDGAVRVLENGAGIGRMGRDSGSPKSASASPDNSRTSNTIKRRIATGRALRRGRPPVPPAERLRRRRERERARRASRPGSPVTEA